MNSLFRWQTLWEGRWVFLTIFVMGVVFAIASPLLVPLPLIVFLFCLWFFRDPERIVAKDPYAIVAPADGIITDVSEEWELPDGSKGFRISIFLSIFDVHINRSPVDGRVVGRQVLTGKHLDARNPLAHQSNQSLLWEIELGNAVPDGTKVWVKQIAGAIARRIVAWKDIGNDLEKGERIGMIRFGSRTDLFLPYGVVIVVTAGQRVRAGSTVVARWNPRFFQRTVE